MGLLTGIVSLLGNGIGPLFVRLDNPDLYPFVVAALLVALVLFLREVIGDVRRFARNRSSEAAARLRRYLWADFGWLLLDWLLLYLVWLAYATPLYRLPILGPPVSGAHWGFVPLDGVYAAIAVVLHGAAALFPLQVLVGRWTSALWPGASVPVRLSAAAVLVADGLAIFGWEARHWPATFTVPVELVLAPYLALSAARLVLGTAQERPGALRVLRVVATCLIVAALAAIWKLHVAGMPADIVGLMARQSAPVLYPYAVAALGISLAASLYNFCAASTWPVQPQKAIQSQVGELVVVWLIQAVLVYGLWLALTTPVDQLPVPAPSPASLAGLALPGYQLVAIITHALVSALALSNLTVAWATYFFRLRPRSTPTVIVSMLAFVAVAVIWEALAWPLWLVVPVELFLAYLISEYLPDWMDSAFSRLPVRTPIGLLRRTRTQQLLASVVYFAAVVIIVFAHDVAVYIVDFAGLYYALVLIDRLCAQTASIWRPVRPQGDDLGLLSPHRWHVTMLVVPAITLLGASGAFSAISANTGLNYTLWIEVGAAATAYALFKPLISFAAYGAGRRVELQDVTTTPTEIFQRLASVLAQFNEPQGRLAPPAASTVVDASVPSYQHQKKTVAESERLSNKAQAALIRGSLNLPVGFLFLLAGLAYHVLIESLHLTPVLNSAFIPLVFGLIALVAGLLPLINHPALDPPRYTSLMLILVTIVVTGLTVLFSVTPLPPAPTPSLIAASSPLDLLRDRAFLASTGYAGLKELLLLLTLGQLGYFYRLIETSITTGQEAPKNEETAEETLEFADWLRLHRRWSAAQSYYQRTLRAGSAEADDIREAGLGLQRLGRYAEALQAYERAIELEPEQPIYWNDKGVALELLGRNDEALDALDHALDLYPEYALAWDNKGDVLSALGDYPVALTAYRRAANAAPGNAVFWDDVGLTLFNLRQYEESLTAFDRALKLDQKRAICWRNKADLLTHGLQRFEAAISAAHRSLQLEPDSVRGWALYGLALHGAGRHDEAREALRHAVTLDPSPTQTWSSYGDALVGLGRLPEALLAYDRALQDHPFDPDIFRAKASVLRTLGREQEAAEAERMEAHIVSGRVRRNAGSDQGQ